VIEIRVEMFSFRNINTFRGFIVISGKDVVNIVDTTGSHSDFREISGPYSSVGIFGFILRILRRIDSIMNISISVFPFLVIILFEVVMSRVNRCQ
jgi:hypothetical protein